MNALIRTVMFLTVFLILVWPRPLFKPDWLNVYREALAQSDCDAAEQIRYLANLDGLPGYRYANALMVSQRKCVFENASDEEVAEATAYVNGTTPPDPTSLDFFYEDVITTSWGADFWIAITIATRPGALDDLKSYRAEVGIVPSCWRLVHPSEGGLPTYTYMTLALNERLRKFQDILERRESDHAFCARRAMALARHMAKLEGMTELSLPVMGLWRLVQRLDGARAQAEYQFLEWVERASAQQAAGVTISPPIGQYFEPERRFFDNAKAYAADARRCYPPTVPDSPLVLIDCSRLRLSGPLPQTDVVRPGLADRDPAVDALYTLFRAERLGADTRRLYRQAAAGLSAACIEEIQRAEALDAASDAAEKKGEGFFSLKETPACGPAETAVE